MQDRGRKGGSKAEHMFGLEQLQTNKQKSGVLGNVEEVKFTGRKRGTQAFLVELLCFQIENVTAFTADAALASQRCN